MLCLANVLSGLKIRQNVRCICLASIRSNSPDCVLEHRQPEPVRGILLPNDAYLARYFKRWRARPDTSFREEDFPHRYRRAS